VEDRIQQMNADARIEQAFSQITEGHSLWGKMPFFTRSMRRLPILALFLASGCFYIGRDQYEDLLTQPSENWSSRDAITVLSSPVAHNLYDFRTNIKVMATPYYPSVILAIDRQAQRLRHWTEEEFRANTDDLLRDDAGMYIDWHTGRFVDSRGNYLQRKEQIDSLMMLITIENKGWPCNSMIAISTPQGDRMVNLLGVDQCYTPEITSLEDKIFLVNEHHRYIKPKYVWGKRHNILTLPETLFAMFQLRSGNRHFLEGSSEMYLVIKGFETDIWLTFPLSMMR
jgi:hypothetical protein